MEESYMNVLASSVIYENPLPQLRSRQSAFPFLCELPGGMLLASHAIGEAFESVDGTTYLSRSEDGGRTWSAPVPMFDKGGFGCPVTDYAKVTLLPDGRLAALGYGYLRPDPALPEGNPETGGLLDDVLFWSVSEDGGRSWGPMTEIPCAWDRHVEASAPLTVLRSGSWVTPITGFPRWDGTMTARRCGRLLRTDDGGRTWNDDAVCMDFPSGDVTCYEQRLCQLASGTIVCIGWNEDTATGARLENHYTFSCDGGRTFSVPRSTGVLGQASSVCALDGERLLALHAVRRDTDRPGIYGCIVDFSEKTWRIEEKALVWEPVTPMLKNAKMAEIFSFLKFGQPGAIRLADGDVLMSHWCAEDGQYKTVATRIAL